MRGSKDRKVLASSIAQMTRILSAAPVGIRAPPGRTTTHSWSAWVSYVRLGDSISDSWTKPDGSYGSDLYGADGSRTGTAYLPEGSLFTYTNDGHGNIATTAYDSDGFKTGDTWTSSDGSRGSDAF